MMARSGYQFDEPPVRHFLTCWSAWRRRGRRSDRSYQMWQEGSHPQRILDLDMLRQKLEYIHNNPTQSKSVPVVVSKWLRSV